MLNVYFLLHFFVIILVSFVNVLSVQFRAFSKFINPLPLSEIGPAVIAVHDSKLFICYSLSIIYTILFVTSYLFTPHHCGPVLENTNMSLL